MKKTFKIVCSSMLSLLLAAGALAGCKDSGSSSSKFYLDGIDRSHGGRGGSVRFDGGR